MGKISRIQINTSKPVYFAGDILTGQVKVSVRKSLEINVVKLKLNGHGFIRW